MHQTKEMTKYKKITCLPCLMYIEMRICYIWYMIWTILIAVPPDNKTIIFVPIEILINIDLTIIATFFPVEHKIFEILTFTLTIWISDARIGPSTRRDSCWNGNMSSTIWIISTQPYSWAFCSLCKVEGHIVFLCSVECFFFCCALFLETTYKGSLTYSHHLLSVF